ncbi:MAG: protein phosphatase 2C domain-containing protein [Propionicimonas sp.]|nr:protein phosphatase 2C domain-containing protein [Propionicimonas sp.]
MTLALRYLAHSEVGLVRKNNQDSAYTSPTMLVVADGMGGAAAGDLASAVAIKELRAVDGNHAGEDMLTALDDAIANASQQISALVASDRSLDGMGSTVCGAMFDGTSLGMANIGDSRAYRYRDGALSRLTRDHSWVQTLVDEGRITEEEALEHPHRSLILRVVNGQPQHLPDLELAEAAEGDRLLICSDGLCGMVTDADIEAQLDGELDDVMARLVGLAHAAGGQDNITIILADIVDGEPAGITGVLGAAAVLDLDSPFDVTTMQLPTLAGQEVAAEDPALAKERARYAPTRRGRALAWVKVLAAAVLTLGLIAGGLAFWYSYTQRQFFVGPQDQVVAVFRGVPEPVLSLPLSTLVEADTTRLADLPPYYQEQVRATITASSLESARGIVATLREKAKECIAQREARAQATQTPTPTPTPTPTTSPLPSTSQTPPPTTPSPSGTPNGTPSPRVTTITPSPSTIPPAPEEC